MIKALVFDMDGTIADFYGVEGWLDDLMNSNPRPYMEAKPIYDALELLPLLEMFKAHGWKIIITSWLSKGSTKAFDEEVRKAKREWLANYNFPFDEIHLVKYGTTKANCTRRHGGYQVLIDDNAQVRKGWHLGDTINANKDITKILREMLDKSISA